MAELEARSAFAEDDGSVPAVVADALARHAAGRAGTREVVVALAAHRLLVPLLEVDADQLEGDDADPCAGQDRAVAAVSVRTQAGTVGLAFTGIGPLRAWDPRARPLPVGAPRAAAALLADSGIALVVDAAGPHPCRLEGLALARLGAGGLWPEPWQDPAVRAAVVAELAPALAAGELAVRLGPGPGPVPADGADLIAEGAGAGPAPGLVVEVRFPAQLSGAVRAERLGVIARRLSASSALREAYEGVLAVRALPAPERAGPGGDRAGGGARDGD